MPKFFIKANKQNTEVLMHLNEILIMNVFTKDRNAPLDQGRLIALTQTHIIYYTVKNTPKHNLPSSTQPFYSNLQFYQDYTKTKIKRIAELDFDCKFEILRDESKDPKYLGTPYAIRFERADYEPVTLFNSSPQVLNLWKQHLEKKINQRGFHALFKPIKKIGKGNFASVYLAERLEDHKMVAVKAFSKATTFSQEKGRESLINQIKVMRKLSQNNVLKLYGVYESDNSIYMTMELLSGGQLFSKIQSKHRFSSEEVRGIMKGLFQGLEHMHSQRIMHRDLKPENIMLRYNNDNTEVVIVDFGLATWADQPTYLFVRCGTPGYVAPEIINIRDLSTKSEPICDVFSVGLIFHILLMGKSVFPGKTYNQVLTQNRACEFDLNGMEYSILTSHAHELLKRTLEKNPAKRITAQEALEHPYFTQIDVQDFCDNGLMSNIGAGISSVENNYPNTPFTQLKSLNDDSQIPKLVNRVSILSPINNTCSAAEENNLGSILKSNNHSFSTGVHGRATSPSASKLSHQSSVHNRVPMYNSPSRSAWKENARML